MSLIMLKLKLLSLRLPPPVLRGDRSRSFPTPRGLLFLDGLAQAILDIGERVGKLNVH
jgi:hypothetical protein